MEPFLYDRYSVDLPEKDKAITIARDHPLSNSYEMELNIDGKVWKSVEEYVFSTSYPSPCDCLYQAQCDNTTCFFDLLLQCYYNNVSSALFYALDSQYKQNNINKNVLEDMKLFPATIQHLLDNNIQEKGIDIYTIAFPFILNDKIYPSVAHYIIHVLISASETRGEEFDEDYKKLQFDHGFYTVKVLKEKYSIFIDGKLRLFEKILCQMKKAIDIKLQDPKIKKTLESMHENFFIVSSIDNDFNFTGKYLSEQKLIHQNHPQ